MKVTKTKIYAAAYCVCLMLITGASDALKGVFLPVFHSGFGLTEFQQSMIITMSYVGNLVFLFVGGYLADRLPRKKFIAALMVIWLAALGVYVFTESYAAVLVTMFFSLGASTMLSTSVNIITPLVFASPALFINIFNFCQGLGITLSQNVGGRFTDSLSSWHVINAVLLCAGVLCMLLLIPLKLPDPEPQNSGAAGTYLKVLKNPACVFLIFMCGFYCVAEHGLQNWLTSYGSEYLGFTVSKSAFFLSVFFGGLTVGRLIFAPLVQRLGTFRSLLIWTTVATLLYAVGIFMGKSGIALLCISGLGFSIIWPTMVLLIGKFFEPSVSGVATGFVIGIANIFDIAFNALFGKAISSFGYGLSIKILAVIMILFAAVMYLLRFTISQSKNIDNL
jgi:fucose permease